jgi:hypothetical protein
MRTHPLFSIFSLAAVAMTVASGAARAGELKDVKVHPPLVELPRDRLAQLAPLLRTGDFALLESDEKGREKQVTTLTFSRATPAAVREVVIHPERYEDFVHNMVGRSVKKNADGTFDHTWKLAYTVASFSGVNRYRLLPPREGEPVGAVEILDPTGMSTYRWEFIPAAHGGGTIVVVYGYTDVRHSGGFIDKVLARADTLEHGLAIIVQSSLHRAMTIQAERHPGEVAPYVPPVAGAPATSYRFLLDRGMLAILRHGPSSKDGAQRLVDFSLIDRTPAPAARILDELSHPERWRYVPSYSKVEQHAPRDGVPVVEIEQALPLMSWDTHFGVRTSGGGVDLFGIEGDLRGARLRFDLRADGNPPNRDSVRQLILRGQLAYDRSSMVMQNLFKIEPLFEDGVNVGLTYVLLRAVRNAVEK